MSETPEGPSDDWSRGWDTSGPEPDPAAPSSSDDADQPDQPSQPDPTPPPEQPPVADPAIDAGWSLPPAQPAPGQTASGQPAQDPFGQSGQDPVGQATQAPSGWSGQGGVGQLPPNPPQAGPPPSGPPPSGPPPAPPGYDQSGFGGQGYPPQGYSQQSYPQQGYGQPGSAPPGYGQPAFGQPGFGQPPQKSGSGTKVVLIVLGVLGVLVLLGVIGAVFLFNRASDVVEDAVVQFEDFEFEDGAAEIPEGPRLLETSGSVGGTDDSQSFTFIVETAGPVQIDVIGQGGFDPVLELRDESGSVIAENDDSDIGFGFDSRINMTLQPGTYEARVRGFASDDGSFMVIVTDL